MSSLFPKHPASFYSGRSISAKDIPRFRTSYYYYNIPFRCWPCFVACKTLKNLSDSFKNLQRHPIYQLPPSIPNYVYPRTNNLKVSSFLDLNEVANRLTITYSITIPNGTTTATAAISSTNISQVPGNNWNSVERFARAPAYEGPYFASARMGERSAHLNRLSSQLNAMDAVLNTGR